MKRPSAALSANLVAVKGAAVPAPDMVGRGTHATPEPSPAAEALPPARQERGAGRGPLSPLNFRVPAVFRREFKTYASAHDLKLNELLRLSFEAYRREQGD